MAKLIVLLDIARPPQHLHHSFMARVSCPCDTRLPNTSFTHGSPSTPSLHSIASLGYPTCIPPHVFRIRKPSSFLHSPLSRISRTSPSRAVASLSLSLMLLEDAVFVPLTYPAFACLLARPGARAGVV
ncbi:hypothetical protein VTO73DRAFT_5634 [Trametes versicolor]